METYIIIIILIALILILWKLFGKGERRRYISQEVKDAVWKRYYEKCAVCTENRLSDIAWHHRKGFSEEGENTEENIVPLCSYHHNLITRYPKEKQ